MKTITKCQNCGFDLEVDESLAGTEVQCPGCGEFVPTESAGLPMASPPLIQVRRSTRAVEGETVFLETDEILISDARLLSGAQMFPLRNVSAVNAVQSKPEETTVWVCFVSAALLGLLAAGLLVSAFISFFQGTGGGGGMIFGALFLGLPAFALFRYGWNRIGVIEVAVLIGTSGNDQKAFTTRDEQLAREIIDALNKAIIYRK